MPNPRPHYPRARKPPPMLQTVIMDNQTPPGSPGTPILYKTFEHGGIIARPDSRAVVKKALEGTPIEVEAQKDYLNLYHIFLRMTAGKPQYRRHRLVRKKVGESKWLLLVVQGDDVPAVALEPGFDPVRGRYKRFAEQLTTGQALRLSKDDAHKARRAWRNYVPKEDRQGLRAIVRKVAHTSDHVVLVMDEKEMKAKLA